MAEELTQNQIDNRVRYAEEKLKHSLENDLEYINKNLFSVSLMGIKPRESFVKGLKNPCF